jgi:nucleoside-diphosphate-sugar epimerase
MRLLVLGGTVFLSKAVAAEALRRGHEVVTAARGTTGSPPDGATHVYLDRDDEDGFAAIDGEYDAVVDVARQPAHVRRAVSALADRAKHWTFVSTCSVYSDDATPGQRVDTAPVREPLAADADEADPANYGEAKVSCERLVAGRRGSDAFVVRAGLIVGPGDPSDRFTYWPERLARGGEVLVPGQPDDPVQLVDVRDLAAWIVDSAETGRNGVLDGMSLPITRQELLEAVSAGVGADATLTWAPQDFLLENGVNVWSGPKSLPLWVDAPDNAGFMARDTSPSIAAGLTIRDLAETARDTLAWVRDGRGDRPWKSGLTEAEENELIRVWHGR